MNVQDLVLPSASGRIEILPLVYASVADSGQWIVRCPYCNTFHRHGAAVGNRASHCHQGDYVLVAENSWHAPYGSQCRKCVTYFAQVDDDPQEIRFLRVKPYTPIDLESSPVATVASYECNHGHHWVRTWAEILGAQPQTSRRCALYRHFDANGVLLYIGISDTPVSRGKDHAKYSRWVQYAARIEAVWLDSREEAERAERDAIVREKPIFNIEHATGDQRERVAGYVSARTLVTR